MNGFPVWSTSTVRPFGSEATKCAFATSATASLHVCVPTVRPASAREPPDPDALGDPTGAARVGLDDVERAARGSARGSPARRSRSRRRRAARRSVGAGGVGVDLLGRERLLEPEDAARGELAAHPYRPLEAVPVGAVDDHVVAFAGAAPRGVDCGQVVLGDCGRAASSRGGSPFATWRAPRPRARRRRPSRRARWRTRAHWPRSAPRSCQTGPPAALPRRSQSAMSTPPSAETAAPLRPYQRVRPYSRSQSASGSVGSLPTRCGARCCSTIALTRSGWL